MTVVKSPSLEAKKQALGDILAQFLLTTRTDELCSEASLQHNLALALRDHFTKVELEQNISCYGLDKSKFIKSEIDIVASDNTHRYAIELKYPRNGAVPEQMFAFLKDIKLCEQLTDTSAFDACFSILITNDSLFCRGRKHDGIYSRFRANAPLMGPVSFPTDNRRKQDPFTLKSKDSLNWKCIPSSDFRYLLVVV